MIMVSVQNIMADGLCDCKGKREPGKLINYVDRSNEIIGTFCTGCGVESLVQEYIGDIADTTPGCLYPRKPPVLKQNSAFQVQCTNTEVDPPNLSNLLKFGDHVTWRRKHLYWHHGIVSEINAQEKTIRLIHWNKDEDGIIKIIHSHVKVNEPIVRIDYPECITQLNSPELVLARAFSRIGDTGYNLFSDNCESFATFCKCGVAKSHQIAWLKRKRIQFICHQIVDTTKRVVQYSVSTAKNAMPYLANEAPGVAQTLFQAETIERLVKGSNWVGAGIMIVTETGFVIWDLKKVFQERQNGTITRKAYIEKRIHRICEGILSAASTILGSLVPELIGCVLETPLEPLEIMRGGIIGGTLGGVAGKALGTALGNALGTTISGLITVNDRAVASIGNLHPGDHIVMYAWLLHPRCHAIVVKKDGTKILVIRKTHSRVVVQEWLPFSKPLFRVEYEDGKCYDPETVLTNTGSWLKERKYDLATYNCKKFARQCKSEFVDAT